MGANRCHDTRGIDGVWVTANKRDKECCAVLLAHVREGLREMESAICYFVGTSRFSSSNQF
jgi:hypothetical protein